MFFKSINICILLISLNTALIAVFKEEVGQSVGLYKEIYLFALLVIFFMTGVRFKRKKLIFFIIFFAFIAAVFLYSSVSYTHLPFFYSVYILKVVLFYFVFMLFSDEISSRLDYNTIDLIKKTIFLFLIVNFFLAFFQRYFLADLANFFLGLSVNDIRGNFYNLVIQTQSGFMRAIGSFSTPMALAEFFVFGIVFASMFVENKVKRFLAFLMCVIGVYFTGYKTAMMVVPCLLVLVYLAPGLRKTYTVLISISLLAFGFLSTKTNFVYELASLNNPSLAKASVGLRTIYTDKVLSDFSDVASLLFGVGLGRHGGLIEYLEGTVPLDSIFLFIAAHFGLALAVIFPFFILAVLAVIGSIESNKNFLFCSVVIMVSGNYFWNNPIVNFPSLFFYLYALVIIKASSKNQHENVTPSLVTPRASA